MERTELEEDGLHVERYTVAIVGGALLILVFLAVGMRGSNA